MFLSRSILARLEAIESRLDAIEAAIASGDEALRTELERKRDQLDAMSRQSLHVIELLDEARQEIERLKSGGS
ncbi:MAG: hypothetical protein KDB80_13545 [Planctomycetes bacterium]|nr:hypothetical protein [Planctomycetota bacterium]